ncbi:MAG: DNA-directed RNA polymerase subunit L [Tissierellales bacterium]|nr:DNA-directed RNA polymerase subunit L [Tissierellales bacterium]
MKIIKDTKKELEIEIDGESHTLCNALRKILMEDKDVLSAAYVIEHPIVGEPKLYINAKNPRKSLKNASETLKSRCEEFKDLVSTVGTDTKSKSKKSTKKKSTKSKAKKSTASKTKKKTTKSKTSAASKTKKKTTKAKKSTASKTKKKTSKKSKK